MGKFFQYLFGRQPEEEETNYDYEANNDFDDTAPPAYQPYESYEKAGCGEPGCNSCKPRPHPCNPCDICPKPPPCHKPCEKPDCKPCHKPPPCNPCPKPPPCNPCHKPPPCNPCHKPSCNPCRPKSQLGNEDDGSDSSDDCNSCKPRKPCRVRVIQTCPPQTCSLPAPRIQCRFVLDKKDKKDCNSCDDREDECCDNRWVFDAETILWAIILLFIVFSVLAFLTNGSFSIDISSIIGKLTTMFTWAIS